MKMSRRLFFSIVLLLFVVPIAFSRIVIQTGHAGTVHDVIVDAERDRAYSGGEDGKVKFWNLESDSIDRSIQVSAVPVVDIALHPEGSAVAAVSSGGGTGATLTVFDTGSGEQLFRVDLQEEPLHLTYSPGGSYIVYSLPNFESLRFLNSTDGDTLSYMRQGTGIVSYFAVASSEETVMTYVPSSGRIDYYRVRSGERIQSSQTRANLQGMELLPGKRHAVAYSGSSLITVDVLTGQILDNYPLGTIIQSLTVDQESGTIGVWTENLQREDGPGSNRQASSSPTSRSPSASSPPPVRTGFRHFNFSGSFLYPSPGTEPDFPVIANTLALDGSYIVAGGSDGAVSVAARGDDGAQLLARNVVAPVSGVAVSNGALHLAVGNRLISLHSRLFEQPRGSSVEVDSISSSIRTLPYERVSGVLHSPDDYIYIWGPREQEYLGQDRGALLTEFDPVTGSVREIVRREWSRIVDVTWFDGSLLLLHEDGVFRQIDPTTGATSFRYSGLGMQKVIGTDRYGIVVGRNRTGPFEASLLQIDPLTGETVLVDSENFMVFDLAYDRHGERLYSLSIRERGTRKETLLQYFTGTGLTTSRTLQRASGEHLDATISLASDSRVLYSSLGESGFIGFSPSGSRRQFSHAGSIVDRVAAAGGLVFTLNDDGSIHIYSPDRPDYALHVTLFEDDTWVALTSSGVYYVPTDRAERHLRYVNERSLFQRELRDMRVSLPLTVPME